MNHHKPTDCRSVDEKGAKGLALVGLILGMISGLQRVSSRRSLNLLQFMVMRLLVNNNVPLTGSWKL